VTTHRVGVLALQGDFREHLAMVERLGAEGVEVRQPGELATVDALIIPGGESTTIGKLAVLYGMIDALRDAAANGMPMYGTCAGMIFAGRAVTDGEQPQLGIIDVVVERNAFGRQNESFETDLDIKGIDEPMHAVFIRAPLIAEAGPEVDILAEHDGRPVVVRQGNILASSFHPELTDDTRLHEMLIGLIELADIGSDTSALDDRER
jgi:5'-phosphate synthase pdxT subunit